MSLETLVAFSNQYGADSRFVLAGGGNTSMKTEEHLYIKGSGTSLATITEEGFVKMDRSSLAAIWNRQYPENSDEREAAVLADLMAARCAGEEKKRPSVETLLHDLFPQKYVLHVHPTLVNGLTCSVNGAALAAELFPDAIWVEETKPGYTLAKVCRDKIEAYVAEKNEQPVLVFLQNHGVFFAGECEKCLEALVSRVMNTLEKKTSRTADLTPAEVDRASAAAVAPLLRMLYAPDGHAVVRHCANAEILRFAASREAFAAIREPLTPDHIVYCKAEPLYLDSTDPDTVIAAWNELKDRRGFAPRIVFVKNLGMFAIGAAMKDAITAEAVWMDAVKITVYAENFGGVAHMAPAMVDFIVNWEVESYRSKVAASAAASAPLAVKIAVVTGSAQGFGAGIAEYLAEQGAAVVIADMNGDGAKAEAEKITATYGTPALAVTVNVSDEDSVRAMIEETVLTFGGLDIFINNAGIVRAGGLEEMTKSNFELVTAVNYTAYFLCVKYATVPMKLQRKASPTYMSDVIEINSKSGLAGSNKNFAYAGSKFGGIGLTQSFAMELAPYGIKVNAICPGNFLDGPLWSDPDRGLFVQYLRAGKVPGAKTVEDVRAFYEAKVPLGRGCRTEDVACAVSYIISQKYETGQALPVTGGQEMLN
ncbi:MAG: SDR family oxidoreductase [Ruminococcaceae bacterium]|nr:SDR family oxidoreductase [Oscillospiraceae bacterium]